MKITVRKDKVIIDGYVNAVDRFSRPLFEGSLGRFVEKILPNVFKKAIARATNIDVLLNHDESRKLADTQSGTAKIVEDNVGLRATVEITDAEVIEKARAGKLRGWSFGFSEPVDETSTNQKTGILERIISSLTLHEVSIIDDRAMPAYFGTSIETRSVGEQQLEIRTSGEDTEIETETDGDDADPNKDTTRTDEANDEEAKAEAEAKAKVEAETLQREADLREASI